MAYEGVVHQSDSRREVGFCKWSAAYFELHLHNHTIETAKSLFSVHNWRRVRENSTSLPRLQGLISRYSGLRVLLRWLSDRYRRVDEPSGSPTPTFLSVSYYFCIN